MSKPLAQWISSINGFITTDNKWWIYWLTRETSFNPLLNFSWNKYWNGWSLLKNPGGFEKRMSFGCYGNTFDDEEWETGCHLLFSKINSFFRKHQVLNHLSQCEIFWGLLNTTEITDFIMLDLPFAGKKRPLEFWKHGCREWLTNFVHILCRVARPHIQCSTLCKHYLENKILNNPRFYGKIFDCWIGSLVPGL